MCLDWLIIKGPKCFLNGYIISHYSKLGYLYVWSVRYYLCEGLPIALSNMTTVCYQKTLLHPTFSQQPYDILNQIHNFKINFSNKHK